MLELLMNMFKQTTLYYYFKKGGRSRQGHDRSEFFLHKVTQSSDLKQLVNVILKYALGSSLKTKIAHMGGEEIFGSYKLKPNLFL
jgi:hypothetical protein